MTVLVLVSIRGDQAVNGQLQNGLTNRQINTVPNCPRLDGTRRRSAAPEMGGYSAPLGCIADAEDSMFRSDKRLHLSFAVS